jgi:ribosome-associated protein
MLVALVAVLTGELISWVEFCGCSRLRYAPMDDGIRVAEDTVIPLEEIRLRASRSSGPGGQHANVTASRIEAVFDVEASEVLTDQQRELLRRKLGERVTAVAQDARSQARNRELALERLRERIADGLRRPKPRRPTRPSRAARERQLEKKRRTSQRKRERRPPTDY